MQTQRPLLALGARSNTGVARYEEESMASVYDVIGLGIASLDFIGVAATAPLLGAKQPLDQWIEAGGGPVATALVTLARLGMSPCMISAVGDDGYGAKIIADLQRAGVDTQSMQIYPGGSHLAFVLAEPGQDRRTVWWHNDPTVLERITLDPNLLTVGRALLIDTHLPELALPAAQLMQRAGGLVMIDAERLKESTLTLLPYCDVQIVSARFGREATGLSDPAQAAAALHARYGKLVVVTAGVQGSWCVSASESFHTPAFTVDVRDTTGAGDVFHGAFLYGLLQGWPLRRVARFASASAALKCRAFGGRAGIPQLDEVLALLAAHESDD